MIEEDDVTVSEGEEECEELSDEDEDSHVGEQIHGSQDRGKRSAGNFDLESMEQSERQKRKLNNDAHRRSSGRDSHHVEKMAARAPSQGGDCHSSALETFMRENNLDPDQLAKLAAKGLGMSATPRSALKMSAAGLPLTGGSGSSGSGGRGRLTDV